MRIKDFKLERYFAKHEFNAPCNLCCSDCETMTVGDLLALSPGTEEELQKLPLSYTESLGHPDLRQEISKLYDNISADEILVFSGAEEAIFAFMNVYLENGDHGIVQFPAYQSLFEIANSIKTDISKLALKFNDSWVFSLKKLEQEITYRTRFLVLNFPHNPTGYSPDVSLYHKIRDMAEERGIFIFSDEVYKFLEYGNNKPLPSMCDIYDNSVSLGVMSKSFGLPGLRIGWLASKDTELLNRIAAFKDYTTICNSAPAELLARIALQNRETILERTNSIISDNLALLETFMKKYSDVFEWVKPDAGPITLIRYRRNEGAENFCQKVLAEKGVLLLPSTLYDIDDAFFRIGYGRLNFAGGLTRLEEYVQENY